MTPIIFLKVDTVKSKLEKICTTILTQFTQGQRILIIAPNSQATAYLDNLLWQYPRASFTPHVVANTPKDEPIVITTVQQNLNRAQILFNLTDIKSTIFSQFEKVYELFDGTTPEKSLQSSQKQAEYQKDGNVIVYSEKASLNGETSK